MSTLRFLGTALAIVMLTVSSLSAWGQLDETCVVSTLNRTAQVDANGVWVLPNVPANIGQVRVRATCIEAGMTRSGQSDFFAVPPDGIIEIADIVFDNPQQVPATLSLIAPETTLTSVGQTVQLNTTAIYPDGSTAEVSAASTGTSYTTSNPTTAIVDTGGSVTALTSGTVLISATNEGALGLITVEVVLSGDSDGDGLPDDFELANGLDPDDSADAFADPDEDGLGVLDEFQTGLDPFDPDTDDDGLLDGEEVIETGTNPLLFDTDGDLVSDGLETTAGSNPLDLQSVDLAPILESFTVEPSSFTLTFNTVVGEASRRLQVTGTLIDGTVLDITAPPYGTAYASSDLTIASFSAEAGRVFAGQDGSATVTASIGAFSASSEVTVGSFSPTALSFIRIPGFANDVAAQGDYAYVAAGARGLYVVDVSDLEAPAIAGSTETPGNANAVDVNGAYAYVADGGSDLRIVDISDPSNPAIVAAVDTSGKATDVAVAGGLAYLTAGIRGLHIIDVNDPEAPFLLGSVDTGDAHGVDASGDLVVVADGTFGIKVIDASDPTAPLVVGSTHTRASSTSAAAGVAVRGRLAWVADGSDIRLGGMRTIDLSEQTTPVVVGSTSNNFGLTGVALERDFAVASDYLFANAVPIFNIAGQMPVFSALLDFSGAPSFRTDEGTGIAAQNGVIFLTGVSGPNAFDNAGKLGDGGLHIGRYLDPEAISNTPPEVALLEPTDGAAVLERRQVKVRASATDDIQVVAVEFLIDGEIVHRDFSSPYEHTFRAPIGVSSLTLGARALDLGDNQTLAEEIILQVLPDASPTLSFLTPAANSRAVAGTTIPIALLATDDVAVASVELTVDGVSQGVLTAPPLRYDVLVPFGSTELTFTAAAEDNVGQTVSAGPLVVAVDPDRPPIASILSPVDGEEVAAGSQLRVLAAATGELGITETILRVDGEPARQDSEPPYEFDLMMPANAGELLLTVAAIDSEGQLGVSSEVWVVIGPDPLTTVFGRVLDPLGRAVLGAEVTTAHGATTLSDIAGFFSLSDQPTIEGDLVVSASLLIEGVSFVGMSASTAPMTAGITDVGDIVLEEALGTEDCPCNDIARWISDSENPAGFNLWSAAPFFDPAVTTCSRDAAVIELVEDPILGVLRGVAVDVMAGQCRVFDDDQSIPGIRLATLPGLAVAEVDACRQQLQATADSKAVVCTEPAQECPCADPFNWQDAAAGVTWEDFALQDFSVQSSTCIDDVATTKLVEAIPQFFFFRGAAVSGTLAECQVFDADGPPSATLAIDPDEVGICRDVLRSAAAAVGLVCTQP